MAFNGLCHINNAFKAVENEPDQSDRIMEENSMVRDLITKILDETGPGEASGSQPPPEKTISTLPTTSYPKNESGNTSYIPPSTFNNYQENLFNFPPHEQNGFNFNGFTNGFVNYSENDVTALLGIESVDPPVDIATPEQLNLLRLAAQEIGGAQFTTPNKFEENKYMFFENQRNSAPDAMFQQFDRQNSLDLNLNGFDGQYRFTNKFETYGKEPNPESTDILSYLSTLNLSDRREEAPMQGAMEFKMPAEMNGHYQNDDFNKLQDTKMLYPRNYQQMPPTKNFSENNFYVNDMMKQIDRSPISQNFEYPNQIPNASMNFKPNGFHNDFFPRPNQMPRDNFQNVPVNDQRGFENLSRENMQQITMNRQNQELARQMSMLMRTRPPPNQLNVDVSFLHENPPFNLGIGALLGPSPPVVPPVLPSPMLDLPLLAPFYTMRNMRAAATSSSILHARLDACYEQWRQLERERKRTEARLALAYPGRAVSSSNSIPVPRLPPCPTRVDRLTVDMLREHTKVLTLMGKMETLRASVCVAQNKRPNKPEDGKVIVLKRGEKETPTVEREKIIDPKNFDPSSWREDVKNMPEIAPHAEVEAAMLAWRGAVAGVQAARRRELHPPAHHARLSTIMQLAEAVKQLCVCARRARCAMWSDLTLTVALAPAPGLPQPDKSQLSSASTSPRSNTQDTCNAQNNVKPNTAGETKEDKPKETPPTTSSTKETKQDTTITKSKSTDKPQEKNQQRRTQNYRKLNPRNDFYQKNQRYDNRFTHRHPYYLATGPIN